MLWKFEIIIIKIRTYLVYNTVFNVLNVLFKLSKTTSPKKLFDYICMNIYLYLILSINSRKKICVDQRIFVLRNEDLSFAKIFISNILIILANRGRKFVSTFYLLQLLNKFSWFFWQGICIYKSLYSGQ